MAQWEERITPLAISAAAAVAGVVLLVNGISDGDAAKWAPGAGALAGAAVLAAVCLRIVPTLWNRPARHRGPQLKHLWLPPERGGTAVPATEQEIADVERKIGHKLPPAYVRILKVQNGGELRFPMWVPLEGSDHGLDFFGVPDLSGAGPDACLARTPDMIREGLIPRGVACVFDGEEWSLCLDYRRLRTGEEPRVVAFDDEDQEHVLAATVEAFLGGLTRNVRYHVYAARGAIGPHPDLLLAELNEALGVTLAPHTTQPEYVAECGALQSLGAPNQPAALRLLRNGQDREYSFPESWSRWVLCCDIALDQREALERRLRSTDSQWVLLHAPPRRLVKMGFYGGVARAS